MKGCDFLVYANTGTIAAPVWKKVGGQQGAALDRSSDSADTTTKDSANWAEAELTIRHWSLDADGLLPTDDEGYDALEDAWMNNEKLLIKLTTANGKKFQGMALITSFPIDAPYDDMAKYSLTFQGSGPLTHATN